MRITERPARPNRGFTLIETMIAVAIVGILSSVAMPEYHRVLLRARAAERATIMDGLARAISETIGSKEGIPGGTWTGLQNPQGTPGTSKRHFDPARGGWTLLPLVVEGDTYYSYSFVALDPLHNGQGVAVKITGEGDLDQDGVHSIRVDSLVGVGWHLQPDPVEANWTREDPNTL